MNAPTWAALLGFVLVAIATPAALDVLRRRRRRARRRAPAPPIVVQLPDVVHVRTTSLELSELNPREPVALKIAGRDVVMLEQSGRVVIEAEEPRPAIVFRHFEQNDDAPHGPIH